MDIEEISPSFIDDSLPILHKAGQQIKNGKVFSNDDAKKLLNTGSALNIFYEVKKTALFDKYSTILNQELDEIKALQDIIRNIMELVENQIESFIH